MKRRKKNEEVKPYEAPGLMFLDDDLRPLVDAIDAALEKEIRPLLHEIRAASSAAMFKLIKKHGLGSYAGPAHDTWRSELEAMARDDIIRLDSEIANAVRKKLFARIVAKAAIPGA